MEVVAKPPSVGAGARVVPPFQRRDVEEWSHLDQLTGMLEHARVEKDHWQANTRNSTHQYGKVVDVRDRSGADGAIKQRERKQLEVYNQRVPGGSLQVIRTQTSASSRWTSASSSPTKTTPSAFNTDTNQGRDFSDLHLALNPLDLSSQKTKASVGRSGSIGGRRPPSRPRSIGKIDTNEEDITTRLNRVSRLCQQIHKEPFQQTDKTHKTHKPNIQDRQSGDGSVSDNFENESVTSIDKDEKEYEKIINQNGVDSNTPSPIEYNNLVNEQLSKTNDNWKKSIQLSQETKQFIDNSISESRNRLNLIRQDLETGRRLNTALRGNNIDLEALDQILKSISPGSSGYSDNSESKHSDDLDEGNSDKKVNKTKRHSFITVESLKEVRGRLRRLSSPIDDYYGTNNQKDDDPDDGIASEDNSGIKQNMPIGVSRVRSYVYGMEAMLGNNRKPVVGTGSLESRTSGKLNASVNRSEDWYNRRKSYGFEQVHNQHDQSNSISLHAKNKMESSTDSGICRSTEIVSIKSNKFSNNNRDINKSEYDQGDINCHKIYNKNGNSTIINVGSENKTNELVCNRRGLNNDRFKKESKQITITIPIISEDSNVGSITRKLYHRQLSENSSVSIEQSDNMDLKRHSIAVDETKYVNNIDKYPYRRTSLVINDNKTDDLEDDSTSQNRKTKKVEFCKTEVHFAAESGRVNIVETDEKPPPTNNFRRRRRNSGIINNQLSDDPPKNGLPIIHFGDTTYEKQFFNIPDHDSLQIEDVPENFHRESPIDIVTISSVPLTPEIPLKEPPENENQPRGILKNKMVKPRPYLLGDNDEIPSKDTDDHEVNQIWGVRLRPVQKEESPMWRSTVTVQNTSYNIPITSETKETETFTPKDNVIDLKSYDSDSTQTEFQKMLGSLNPIRKQTESFKTQSSSVDLRRSSWSVADRIKQVENMRWIENKGYSTKVNFGSGEATVVENRDTVWPTQDDNNDDKKHTSILNKGLVVRIGRDDSNHTVCSKTTTNQENTTTTTKITIDMSPSPSNNEYPMFNSIKLPRASLHSLKSTSLIINTISNNEELVKKSNAIPEQLAALKKLYDEASEHSDDSERADEEVRSYMSGGGDDSDLYETEDVQSVVSGSWSKMRAFRAIKQHLNNNGNVTTKENEMIKNIINHQSYLKRDFPSTKPLQSLQKNKINASINNLSRPSEIKPRVIKNDGRKPTQPLTNLPRTDKRQMIPSNKLETKNDNLSSPMLVGNSIQKSTQMKTQEIKKETLVDNKDKYNQFNKILVSSYVKNVPQNDRKGVGNNKKITGSNSPRSRESTPPTRIDPYYNAIRSPKLTKKYTTGREETRKDNKPDLIQHYIQDTREYVNLSTVFNDNRNDVKNNRGTVFGENRNDVKNSRNKLIDKVVVEDDRSESPVYENIDDILSNQPSERESSIIQELTKAADQILQAVNGYTDDDSIKLSSDDEDDKKNKYRRNSDILETITESKSWKQTEISKKQSENIKSRNRVYRPTSSTSSLESVTKEYKPVAPVRPNRSEKLKEERMKKKLNGNGSEISKITKQRRLQRASSREALLQSHGSSSEDLPSNVEVRKPRLVRKVKNQGSSTTTTSNDMSKRTTVSQSSYVRKRECEIRRSADRVPVVGLQEIRHKTAISTIRSTAEKAASRAAVKNKTDDLKKKNTTKSSFIRSNNTKCQMERGIRTISSRESGSTLSAIRTSSGVSPKKAAT